MVFVLASLVYADTFDIPVQGTMTDANGAPLQGPRTVTISLHRGLTEVVSHEAVVNFERGAFSALLPVPDVTGGSSTFAGTEPLLLTVQALGGVASQAVSLGMAGRAAWAADAGTLDGLDSAAFRPAGQVPWSEVAATAPAWITNKDADLLDGLNSTAFRPAGTVAWSEVAASAPASITSRDADLLDGLDSTAFRLAGTVPWADVNKTGATGAGTTVSGGQIALDTAWLNLRYPSFVGSSLPLSVPIAGTTPRSAGAALELAGDLIAIQQTTSEANTRIFADVDTAHNWGLYHRNSDNTIHFTRRDGTGIETWSESGPGGATTTTSVARINLESGASVFAGPVHPKFEGFMASTTGQAKPVNWSTVAFTNLLWNTFPSGSYDAGNGRFVAPYSGYYRFSSSGYFPTAGVGNERIAVGFSVAGTLYSFCGGSFSAGDTPLALCSMVIPVNAGEIVRVEMFTALAATMGTPGSHQTWFQGEFVGRF